MRKYINKGSAKKLLVIGGVVFMVSLIINFTALFSVYGKANSCSDKTASCTLITEQITIKIAIVVGYIAIGLVIVGLTILLLDSAKNRKR